MTVQELFEKIALRMSANPPPQMNFLDAVNSTLEIIGRVLLQRKSPLLKTYAAVTVNEGEQTYLLPDVYWGMVDQPYTTPLFPSWNSATSYSVGDKVLVGKMTYISIQNTNVNNSPVSSTGYWESAGQPAIIYLDPLNPGEAYQYDGITGPPAQLEVLGEEFTVYPSPDGDYVIKFGYSAQPSVESFTDEIPFAGLFDRLIEDAVLKVGMAGGWVSITPDWAYIENGLNTLLRNRSPKKLVPFNIKKAWA